MSSDAPLLLMAAMAEAAAWPAPTMTSRWGMGVFNPAVTPILAVDAESRSVV
jgi:hypothetical protein